MCYVAKNRISNFKLRIEIHELNKDITGYS